MENTLRQLFDFQRFIKNDDLEQMIAQVQREYSGVRELTDDEMEFVNAAAGCITGTTPELEHINMEHDSGRW